MKISETRDVKSEAFLQHQQAGMEKPAVEIVDGDSGFHGDHISISSQTRDINMGKGVIDKLPEAPGDIVKRIKDWISRCFRWVEV